MPGWNPYQYLKFCGERTQPSLDLIARIALENPASIIDIGCGPGNSTAALRRRWPSAGVTGLDSSPEMIAAARKDHPQGEWIIANAATFRPNRQYDLVFSNATLQWIHHHETLIPKLLSLVAPGGVFAAQVPSTGDSPLAQSLKAVAARPKWSGLTAGCESQNNYRTAEYYYPILRSLGGPFSLWQTTYYHVLESQQDLIEWYRGTGMKPFLDRLPGDAEKSEFEAEVLAAAAPHFPPQTDGRVLFPFKRIFFTVNKQAN
jgi:trans-aconitate 2-methyltransferase